jgi:predicted AAA+ superfamily ATPase
MAITNHDRVGKALNALRDGLKPFVERELKSQLGAQWAFEVKDLLSDTRLGNTKGDTLQDAAALLVVMDRKWGDVFRNVLGKAERSLVNELIDVRNRWAHQELFSGDDTYRALDSASRLLSAVSAAAQAEEVEKTKQELLRVRFDEQVRGEKRKSAGTLIESAAAGTLKPWREVITPHKDVASGQYQQAEFAADLWQVHVGGGSDEYRKPAEFFRRTYLTESLKQLLAGALKRASGKGGDPVVQLQTNFGGGKTHSMLALYHLFSGTPVAELAGLEVLLKDAGVDKVPKVRRVVLVGNKLSPGNPTVKDDGTVIRTLWGELAYQLGGKKAFDKIRADDEKATSPGDRLRELFNEYGPALILIDEWVAYARQLHDQGDLPGGSFETHFTFAQALTEAARDAGKTLLVISLPASDTATSPHAQGDDTEVGGLRGREALARLRNAVGRVESSWRPASAEESFEIVRRRLFETMTDPTGFKARDVTAREFSDTYRTQHEEFPPECKSGDYEKRIKDAYPIHPEIFDRLYEDWSTLLKFQRTRGVLRLMASVIHSLWEKGDRNPLIMPCSIPIDDPRVQFELTRYLSDNWPPVIEKDVDGPHSLPLRTDAQVPNLGKYHACRRVARTIYLGSAPTGGAANKGVEDRRVKLGCVMPGESPAIFGDALRRLSAAATYLYQDGTRYWYATQPTVTKLADDRAEQLRREPDKVAEEIRRRLTSDLRERGDLEKVHLLPASGADVPDEMDARLVVLGAEAPFSKEAESPALATAKAILEARGTTPRLYRNSLVYLAPDKARLVDLEDATRRYLAWDSIVSEAETLDLSPHQRKQAEGQVKNASGAVTARLPETYQWLLVPVQTSPQALVDWQSIRLTGNGGLAVRASNRLRSDELLLSGLAPTRLRMELDRVPLWRTPGSTDSAHVAIKLLVEDFARYLYLPRLKTTEVLYRSIADGVKLLTWAKDSFAFADSYDETADRYRGLQTAHLVDVSSHASGVLVKPERAQEQLQKEAAEATRTSAPTLTAREGGDTSAPASGVGTPPTLPAAGRPRRFHATVEIDPQRAGRDAGKVADEVLAHLVGLIGAAATVTIEIEASFRDGAPESVVRTVSENCRTLKFKTFAFEKE